MPEHQLQNIDVTVVVSGQPERLKVNVHQTLAHLVHEAPPAERQPGPGVVGLGASDRGRTAARTEPDRRRLRHPRRHDALPQPEGRGRRLGQQVSGEPGPAHRQHHRRYVARAEIGPIVEGDLVSARWDLLGLAVTRHLSQADAYELTLRPSPPSL